MSTIEKKSSRRKRVNEPSLRDRQIILERQETVYKLYRGGASVREVAAVLKAKGFKRASKSTIANDLRTGIAEAMRLRDLTRDQMLDVLIESLRDLQAAFAVKVYKEKDVVAGRLLLDIIKEFDRLLGISKRAESETDAKTALAQLLGLDPDQIADSRDEFVEDDPRSGAGAQFRTK